MLGAMLGGLFPIERDADGYCFIDRDPRHFPLILNFLRGDDTIALPKDPNERAAILREAQFYGLDALAHRLTMQCLTSGLVAHWPFDEGTGIVGSDRSGNGTHARLGNPRWSVGPDGRGSALEVGHQHPVVRFPHVADVFPIGDAPDAISAWVRKGREGRGLRQLRAPLGGVGSQSNDKRGAQS
jgi:hypothetical protein